MSRFVLIASLLIAGCVDAGPTDGPGLTEGTEIAAIAVPLVLNGTAANGGANTVRLWDPNTNSATGSVWASDANHMVVIYTQGDVPDGSTTGDPTMYAWLIADTSPRGSAGTGLAYIYRIWRILPADKAKGTFQSLIGQVFGQQQAALGQGALAVQSGAPAGGATTGGPHIGHGGDGGVAYPSSLLTGAVTSAQSQLSQVRSFRGQLSNYTFPAE